MKVAKEVLYIVFMLFALVQLNDDELVWFWVFLYGSISAVFRASMAGKYSSLVNYVLMALCIGACIYYFDGVISLVSDHEVGDIAQKMKADKGYIEESRESLGSLIGLAALIFLHFASRKKKV